MNQIEANIIIEQYEALKTEHPNSLLVVRVGSHYEAFGNDARQLAEACQLRLNHRNRIDILNVGFPCSSAPQFIEKLTKAGLVVAVADGIKRTELPPEATIKNIISRPEFKPEPDGDILWTS